MKDFMNNIIENWHLYVAFICVIILMVQKIIEFIDYPTEKKTAVIKASLLEWVREAEAELGCGTGKFKLSMVYDKFVAKYPVMAKWISLDKFNEWVEIALQEMQKSFINESVKNNALGKTVSQ